MSIQDNLKYDEEEIAAWNAHDVQRAAAVFPDNVMWIDAGSPQPMNKDGIRQYLQGWFSAFPDIKITVTNRVITEDQVAAELNFSGTNTGDLQLASGATISATGKTVHGKGTYFVRFKGGKPVEVHSYPDLAGMMMQLGLMPMPGA
jgi:predicted ester cyclase